MSSLGNANNTVQKSRAVESTLTEFSEVGVRLVQISSRLEEMNRRVRGSTAQVDRVPPPGTPGNAAPSISHIEKFDQIGRLIRQEINIIEANLSHLEEIV